ncbi:CD225/dispanin family protein [Amycolatopsis sp. H20-H5]|uniref:CD225/dispanin family protein n=1 Tax=Amycolatopsis sp. H20-H5 TaxID=3046309 RepID=UPI002DBB0E67|nr:CD225/dispanin family protein [Amycolatopsis sp. H20-H5]MEC3977211.1 CD225/dispanin family protein [Amycolatopsis sp. H20-H5]
MTESQVPPPPPEGRGAGYNPGPPPASNLVWGIVTTVLCCLPFGVVSIVQAAKVAGLWANEQPEAALAAARSARTWAIAAAVFGLVLWVLVAVLIVVGVLSLGDAA